MFTDMIVFLTHIQMQQSYTKLHTYIHITQRLETLEMRPTPSRTFVMS